MQHAWAFAKGEKYHCNNALDGIFSWFLDFNVLLAAGACVGQTEALRKEGENYCNNALDGIFCCFLDFNVLLPRDDESYCSSV